MEQENGPSAPQQVVNISQVPRKDNKTLKDAYSTTAATILGAFQIIIGVVFFYGEIDIIQSYRPKGTSHMLEKGTLSTPSSNNFLIFFTFYFFIRKHLLIKTVNIFESAVVTKPNHFPVTILLSRPFSSLGALFATHMAKKRCQTLVCWEGSLLFDRFGLHTMLPLFKLQSPEVGECDEMRSATKIMRC